MKKSSRPFGKVLMILAIVFFYLPILYMIICPPFRPDF